MLILCLFTSSALAEVSFDGTVVSGETVCVTAPFGGTVETMQIREGSILSPGDEIASLSTTKIYAPYDGEVISIFAQPGDYLEDISARYGAALYMTPENLYSIEANISYAYNTPENRYVSSGETVYISCQSDSGAHTAEGVITTVSGTTYTVLTTGGELKLSEDVRIYRSSDYAAKSRIGGGRVSRVSDLAVSGSGSLLTMHVKAGDTVQRGQLLFETVGGSLDGYSTADNRVLAPYGGIVATVNAQPGSPVTKGDSLLTLYPLDKLRIEIDIPEFDLCSISEGDTVTFTLHYQDDEPQPSVYSGVVESISYLSTEINGEVFYKGYISFDYNQALRLGMNATVTLE